MPDNRLRIVYKPISELHEYSNNPRRNDEAVKSVAQSIREFGFIIPVVIDSNDVIVAGHTRVKACYEVGITDVPCIVVDDLSEEQVRAFRLADNRTAEIAEWDYDKLAEELNDILDIDMTRFGFNPEDYAGGDEGSEDEGSENPYSSNMDCPQYEPTGRDVPLDSLVDTSRTDRLIAEIDGSDVPEDVKRFLRLGAQRHLRFDYHNIAEYYCNAPPEVQDLFERSALVIIDYDDALRYGFVKASQALDDIRQDWEGSEDGAE